MSEQDAPSTKGNILTHKAIPLTGQKKKKEVVQSAFRQSEGTRQKGCRKRG